MNRHSPVLMIAFCLCFAAISVVGAAEAVLVTNQFGVYGYTDTPKLPWCEWRVHDPYRPAPPRIDPGKAPPAASIPSDAVVLFDGMNVEAWGPLKDWKLEKGTLVSGSQQLTTREHLGSMQLHVEWMCPDDYDGPWYNRGNNGVVLMGQFEIQIFDSFNEKIYPDGQCAAIYGQTPPLVNATRPPGEWQSFDIVFIAPRFEGDTLKSAPRVTVLHNGVLVQLNEEIRGELSHRGLPQWKAKTNAGPLVLAGHGCAVRFRNIWCRRL